jgi:hypothetical protein
MASGFDQILVYRYSYWDEQTRSFRSSDSFATLDVIMLGLGKPIPESGIKVSAEDVGGGVYIPPPGVEERLPLRQENTDARA